MALKYLLFPILLVLRLSSSMAEELPPTVPVLPEVVVIGSQTDTVARRDFVAGKIIIGRKRIEESGLQNVYELLRREPAITIGKDGRIGLLGLPSYTQILFDGSPSPAGKSLADLDLVHVERIEIVKSTTAEFGPFGIAGTINIVTRQIERKKNSQLRVGISTVAAGGGANVAWSTNQSEVGSPLSFSAQLSTARKSKSEDSDLLQSLIREGLSDQVQLRGTSHNQNTFSTLSATSSIAWQVDSRNKLTFSSSIGLISFEQADFDNRRWSDGNALDARHQTKSPFSQMSLPLKWTFRQDEQSAFELNWLSNRLRSHSDTSRQESFYPSAVTERSNTQSRELDGDSLKLNYKVSLVSGHDIKVGAHITRNHDRGEYMYWVNGVPDVSLDALGTKRNYNEDQHRLFLQDEWRAEDTLSFDFGLVGEERLIDLVEGNYRSQAQYLLLSPSVHLAKKFDKDGKRQLRVSMAQSYKAPGPDQFTLRPQIHPLAPCSANGQCAANSIDTADTSGNLNLLPERALGLNVSYEQGFGAESQVSIEFYARSIDRLMGTDITLENVSWANVARYVARPANLGNAFVQGVDLEMKLALREFWIDVPKIELRGSVGVAQSVVSTVPGPDNRLSDQLPWRAKFGVSYAAKDIPIKLNVDASWLPTAWTRISTSQRLFTSQKFNLSANATWQLSSDTRLMVNLDDLFAQSNQRFDDYITNDKVLRQQTNSNSHPKLGIQLEFKL